MNFIKINKIEINFIETNCIGVWQAATLPLFLTSV